MTDPTLTEQLEQEATETAAAMADEQQAALMMIDLEVQNYDPAGEMTEPPVDPTEETPADPPPAKLYYKANRHDRRRRAALARKLRKEKHP